MMKHCDQMQLQREGIYYLFIYPNATLREVKAGTIAKLKQKPQKDAIY